MKKQRKDWKRISASALLAGTMVLSNLGTVIPVQASDTGVSVQDAGENLSDLEPAAWSNPIVQSYEADMEHPWKKANCLAVHQPAGVRTKILWKFTQP